MLRIKSLVSTIGAAVLIFLVSFGGNSMAQDKGLVLVAGGSGRTGAHLMNQLTQAGYRARGLTRNVENAQEKVPGDFDWVAVDVRDIETLRPAFDGVDFVVSALGSGDPTSANNGEAVDFGGNRNLIDLAVEHGITKFVMVTSMSAGNEDPEFWLNKRRGNLALWKGRAEDHLRESGLDYAIIRPGGLAPQYEPGTRGLKFSYNTEIAGMIHRADLASVCIAALGNSDASSKTIEVVSDETAAPDAWREDFVKIAADTAQ